MKTYGGAELQVHAFLTSALDGGEWPASQIGCFFPEKGAFSTHSIGGWVGLRTYLGAMGKYYLPLQGIEPRFTVHVSIPTELFWLLHALLSLDIF
jgi:hypothetical protein